MRLVAVAVLVAGLTVAPAVARASDVCMDTAIVSGPCADVLAQEARWLTAITDGDVATIESILSPNYRHTTSDGRFLDRAAEIAGTKPLSLTMTPSEQVVDFAGDVAVVHGVNTIDSGSRGVHRERFTDVFVLEGGTWLAMSAQETAI